MIVGVLRVELLLDDVYSLKEKRHIIKSIIDKLKSRFNASVAEVALNDLWKNAVIGISCVSNDSSHLDSMLSKIADFVENDGRAIVANYTTEKIYFD